MSYTEKPAEKGETPSGIEGAPEFIYLQTGGCKPGVMFDNLDVEQVTWCTDPMEDDDAKYIRADVAERELSDLRAKLATAEKDAERLAYLTADHDNAEIRTRRNHLLCRMPVMSHSAACADIDIGIAAIEKERGNG